MKFARPNNRSITRAAGWLVLCAGLPWAACAPEDAPPSSSSQAVQRGDSGPEIEALNTYLHRYGYFPNADLARAYPAWGAVVPRAPAHPAVFDEYTEQALREFQRRAGVPETGVLDAETQAVLDGPRCGYPDSEATSDEKWARKAGQWATSNLRYRVETANAPAGKADTFTNQVATSFAAWTTRSGFSVTKTSSTAEIVLRWITTLPNTTNAQAGCSMSGSNYAVCTIEFNANLSWTFNDNPLTPGSMDFGSVAIHEIGHALGLAHSSIGTPVMFAFLNSGVMRAQLVTDDVQAIHAAQPGHSQIGNVPGDNPTAIVAGDNSDVWAIGGQFDGNGGQMFKRNSDGSWSEHPFGGRGVMMAYDGSQIWHINSAGRIYRAGNGWVRKAGEASAIAAGGNQIFHLSKAVTRGTRDHDIYRWNGSTNNWDWVPGYASDLAVVRSPLTGLVELWYTNEFGEVWSQPASGGDARPALAVPGGACGISGGADGMIYAFQCPYNANGMPVYMLSQQLSNAGTGPGSETPAGNGWVLMPAGTTARDMTSTREINPATNARIYHIGTNGLYSTK